MAVDLLRKLNLPTAIFTQGLKIITTRHEASGVRDDLLQRNSTALREASAVLEASLINAGVSSADALVAVVDFRERIEAESLSIAEGEGTPDEKHELLSDFISNEISKFGTLPTGVTQPIPEGTAPAIKEAIFKTREVDTASYEIPPGLLAQDTLWDSWFENHLETIQNPDADESDIAFAKNRLLKSARARFQELRARTQIDDPDRMKGEGIPLSEDETLEVLRTVSFAFGFTLKEIEDRKTSVFGIEIPEKYLDPRFVILFQMASPEDFREFSKTEEGQEQIYKVMEALPAKVKTGTDQEDFNRFVGMQMKLLQRYRPSQGGGN
jgi:hypothetical protein